MKTLRVKQVADRLKRHPATIFRWINLGLDIYSEDSIHQFSLGKKRSQSPNLLRKPTTESVETGSKSVDEATPDLNLIALAPIGKRGAAAALQRLEEIEERAHARLMRAIEHGNPFEIKNCQEFYLRSSESLRRLDLAFETERRKADEQLPLREVQDVARQIGIWFVGSFTSFLNAETPALMATTDLGSFKYLAIETFRGILHREVKTALRINPTILPTWAVEPMREAWNIS
jgi:hypothetical protein